MAANHDTYVKRRCRQPRMGRSTPCTNNLRKKILYVTGGTKPKVVDYISQLTGLEPVDGFKNIVADEDIALVVIDCGGTLRCGLYPKKICIP